MPPAGANVEVDLPAVAVLEKARERFKSVTTVSFTTT
jgi:hypothetical protein